MSLLVQDATPRPGDLVLARIDKLGQHKNLELTTGRRARLFPATKSCWRTATAMRRTSSKPRSLKT